jgi:hypothetical protein
MTGSIVAEAVLAIWRKKPHQAKFLRKEHFGKLYHEIFSGLNAAQAIMAVLVFRAVENERKRPTKPNPPDFLPYSSHYLAMIIGERILDFHEIGLEKISHKNIADLIVSFEEKQTRYHSEAVHTLQEALFGLYGKRELSLQQLSATFRRGDLMESLETRAGRGGLPGCGDRAARLPLDDIRNAGGKERN